MDADAAAQVVNYLLSASMRFTPSPFEPTNMAVWYDHLRDIEAEVGVETARRIVESDKDWPSFARFREVAKIVGRDTSVSAPHTCPCLGVGLEVDPEADSWRPCERCNPEGYERWKKGRYRPKFAGPDPSSADKVAEMRLQLPDPKGGEW